MSLCTYVSHRILGSICSLLLRIEPTYANPYSSLFEKCVTYTYKSVKFSFNTLMSTYLPRINLVGLTMDIHCKETKNRSWLKNLSRGMMLYWVHLYKGNVKVILMCDHVSSSSTTQHVNTILVP